MRKKHFAAFIGLSHLGLVTSIGWTSLKHPVIGVDPDKNIVESLNQGKVLVMEDGLILNEPGLQELFSKSKRYYRPTSDFSEIGDSELVFFAKDTPKTGKNPENEIFKLIGLAIPYFKNNVSIIVMSQVPVGFCRKVLNYIKNTRPELAFSLNHWVDTIVMTTAIDRFLHPERIIIGMDDTSKPFPQLLSFALKSFLCPVFKMSLESAEITKAAINLYLANSVTFANTLSDFCEVAGGNINEITPALKSDKRIGQYSYINPGLRIAGGHLERDLFMLERLAKVKNISSGSVGFILKQNSTRYKWALKKINSLFKGKFPSICIWGLSYKKNTTSTKNAPSIEIIKALSNQAKLKVYDSMAILPSSLKGYIRYADKYEALYGADCLLLLTDWDEFENVPVKRLRILMKSPILIDVAGVFKKRSAQFKNFKYISMGVGNPPDQIKT